MKEIRVYTKTGDSGETSLGSGTRVRKDHPRLEAYGTVDELNAFLGLVQGGLQDQEEINRIGRIQKRVFVVSSNLAVDDQEMVKRLPQIEEEDILELERAMDGILDSLPPLRNFILPGGNFQVAACHVARTVCRRAERMMIRLTGEIEIDPLLIKYINRLSDYLFVLARKTAYDTGVGETLWTAGFREAERQ
jgi:cob(I)alamin adenosyltransferase